MEQPHGNRIFRTRTQLFRYIIIILVSGTFVIRIFCRHGEILFADKRSVHPDFEYAEHFIEMQDRAFPFLQFGGGKFFPEPRDSAPSSFLPCGIRTQKRCMKIVRDKIFPPAGVIRFGEMKLPLRTFVEGIVSAIRRDFFQLPPAGKIGPVQVRQIDVPGLEIRLKIFRFFRGA